MRTQPTLPEPAIPDRIATLDLLRGLAVMGILLANLPAFALPGSAYFSPLAWGGATGADRLAWFLNFVLVEGRMRGLFSLLFGASMLLVVDRAVASDRNPVTVHYRRMAWLFVFGCAHLYLLWWGDILAHYALVGAVAFAFVLLPVRWLLAAGAALVLWQVWWSGVIAAIAIGQEGSTAPAALALAQDLAAGFGRPPRGDLLAEAAAMRGSYAETVAWRWHHNVDPFTFVLSGGADTLAFMLFGMAGLRSGFVTGSWPRERYRRWALNGLLATMPVYVGLAVQTTEHGFAAPWVFLASMVVAPLLRPIAVAGYVALAIVALRPERAIGQRIAAAGRTAFSNYLGTSLVMTAVFQGWGLGQFARWSRADLYLMIPLVWALMLAWSKPWLGRYRFGPLEWLWRTLARGRPQPLRR